MQRRQFSFRKTSIKVSLKNIIWNVFFLFGGEKMSKGFSKFCNPITNLILGQIIVSNLTNVRKQNSRINYARLH